MRVRISYYPNGQMAHMGFEDRTEDDPPGRAWNEEGQLVIEEYTIDGKRHRTDGPAYKLWDDDGTLRTVLYYIHGKPHRAMGPAVTNFYRDILILEYWVDGEHIYRDKQLIDKQDQLYLQI